MYYDPIGVSAENLTLMRRIDEQYLRTPCFGRRRMGKTLGIDDRRAGRLMRRMGLEAIYPKPRLSQNDAEHRIYPYLLRNVAIVRPNQVWSSDINLSGDMLQCRLREYSLVQPVTICTTFGMRCGSLSSISALSR